MEHRLLNLDSGITLNTSLPHLLLIWYSPPMPSTNSTDMTQFTSFPVLVLLIWYSLQLPSTSPTDTIANLYPSATPTYMIQSTTAQILVDYCNNTSPTDTLQSTTAPVSVLLIPHNPQLPQYQSCWYDTGHFCPSANPTDTLQYTFDQVPLLGQRCTVAYNLITSPSTTAPVSVLTNILQPPTVPVTVLIIRHSTILPQCQFYL